MKKVLIVVFAFMFVFVLLPVKVFSGNDRGETTPEEVVSLVGSALERNRLFAEDLGLDPDSLKLEEPLPLNIYSYTDENRFGFSSGPGWLFPVSDASGKCVMIAEVTPGSEGFEVVLSGADDTINTAADLIGNLAAKAGSTGETRLLKYRSVYAVYSEIGGEERLIVLPGFVLDSSYLKVTDHRQLPTLSDLNEKIREEEKNSKGSGEDIWGSGAIVLLPDLTKTFEPKIPTYVLPAVLGALAVAAVVCTVLALRKKKTQRAG